ncbi:mechanosensitive ion channel domain-containing protein [Neorhodopirellula pilleata]|uniref:Mechanosensitive channel MscK n=1 Tax=Neorhodopirellula pilleata TaxID=2714738 RepID=A0A5C6AWU3_9BACT|nr:mechanosensitive ion channel domain-containing protein [Neorhodopirellula pilleata]TWU03619.1 Mechanosensitive channel MscK precursor [Neorhodopirellula pilleata]
MRTIRFLRFAILFWATIGSIVSSSEVPATPPVVPPSESKAFAGALSLESLERSLAEVEQTDLPVEAKLQVADNYRAAIANVKSAAANDARHQALIAETETVAQRATQLRKERESLKDKKPAVDANQKLQELEQLLVSVDLQISTFKKARADADAELQSRAPRRKEIREKMEEIRKKISDSESQLRSLATAEPTPSSLSLAARLSSRRLTLEKEIPALEAELTKFDAEESADLVRSKIELATLNSAHAEKLAALLQEKINAAREHAALESVRVARQEAVAADPALKIYAEQNQMLAEQLKSTADAIAKVEGELTASTTIHQDLIREFTQTRRKIESVGLTSSVGALLRKQLTTLPDVETRRKAVAERQGRINETQFQLFEYEEQHEDLSDLDRAIGDALESASQEDSTDDVLLESAARELMERKREMLDELVRNTGKYFDTLIELDMVDRQVVELENEYSRYINQRVLWIRSARPLTEGVLVDASHLWWLQAKPWTQSIEPFVKDAKSHPIAYGLIVLVCGMLLINRRKFRSRMDELGVVAKKVNCRSIIPTLRVLILTTVVSLALPLLCILLGWRLGRVESDTELTSAIGRGLWTFGLLWASVDWIRVACRPQGLAESHFGWPQEAIQLFRSEFQVGAYLALPIAFVTSAMAASDGIHERNDAQRIGFVIGMSIASVIFYRLLRVGGPLRDYFHSTNYRVVKKLKHGYAFAAAVVPGTLAALAVAGYLYTAKTLFWHLFATCVFVVGLVVIRALLFRMLMLRRRHLSMEQARQRAVAAQSAAALSANSHPNAAVHLVGTGNDSPMVAGIVTEDKQADISAHSLQSRRLIGSGTLALGIVGMWMIWIQVLPALSMIGNYKVWGTSTAATTTSSPAVPLVSMPSSQSADPATSSSTSSTGDEIQDESITLSDLALAVLIVVVTFVLFRNGPGLLEISVLQQLPLDTSVRYAITTLVSYAIVMIGTVSACSTIGLQWSQIQWLATALTFGLAFGLQEMFANFVAGLIILLERPIRVGDIVTVDDVTGVVSRIRIRATSITNWDRKEYVVPNKEFITGRLLNWTLSDQVNRIVIDVGLAYGSDTQLARELLLEAANNHPLVLKDPASIASFEGFGDNALNLRLRTFLPSLENRLQVITELHTTIDLSFREAGLEIAFPQRDLHIRTVGKEAKAIVQAAVEDDVQERREAA